MCMKLKPYVESLKREMENLLGCPFVVEEDSDCAYPCKLEYARNYARDHHVLRVNPGKCPNSYPVFTMLLLAKLQLQKLPNGAFGLLQPVSDGDEQKRFDEDFKNDRVGQEMLDRFGPEKFDGLEGMLRSGLVTQTCTQVLELLASDVVCDEYPDAVADMKQYLKASAVEGAAMTYEQLLSVYPEFIVSANRQMNLMFAMKCGEICGEKLIDAYKPSADEVDQALDLYNFYRAERESLKSGGKIVGDVLEKFLTHLKVNRYAHLQTIEIAPLGPMPKTDDGLTDEQRKSLKDFYENHGDTKADAPLMALGMYKVLRELKHWPLESVRSLAIEIAMIGATGISPKGKYTLRNLPNRGEIFGLELLAYYYVSWAKVFPDKLKDLGLPYAKAYKAAMTLYSRESD